MIRQLSFLKRLFSCDSATCKSGGDAVYKVTTTFYPHGKQNPPAWTNVELLCQQCVERLEYQRKNNPFINEHNSIKIEAI